MSKMRLIPFTMQEVLQRNEEAPRGVEMIGAQTLWEEGYEGDGSVIAVIDSGCQIDHPDLEASIIDWHNFTSGSRRDVTDENGHGTHVAGTIAASLNEYGVAGVAPKSKLLILKAFDQNGETSYQTIIQAIQYATKWRGPRGERVRIISMSFGGKRDYSLLHKSIQRAVQQDILVVCAAGNEGDGNARTTERMYPGFYKEVVQVGAVNYEGQMADFTNTNDEIDLVAPGVDILSTYPGNQYARLSGTSMATPHVAGAAALLLEKGNKEFERTLTEPELFALVVKHTRDLGLSKSTEGNGLIDLRG
ncbi:MULTISPECIES: S8 family peptidase [Pontibacillus]|uniref:S8 family peptidase n=1 Tax=Pontibacillus chungwhensis TaxID=265426 RepID=A0ABY8V2F3_9BACI|nr:MULTISPECIES: S8 family peptidase [Pontibacillus]MCD5322338.1 S8 family peptidase [Pontibacillus sp. HN14]WIF99628.1 S8 family peptidase [Pontibacillus chungwhensis]